MRKQLWATAVLIGAFGLLILAMRMPNLLVMKGDAMSDAETKLTSAVALMRDRKYSEAAGAFAAAETAGADLTECRRKRAECLFQAKEYAEAVAVCTSLEAHPRHVPNENIAPYIRGRSLEALEMVPAALEAYRLASTRGNPAATRRLAKAEKPGG